MKKKIIALVLAAALIGVSAVSGTLAYLTDTDQGVNVFTIGNIDIDLSSDIGVYPSKAAAEANSGEYTERSLRFGDTSAAFSNIMPTNYIKNEVTVTNVGKNAAYVRVISIVNNADLLNTVVDTFYETKYDNNTAFKTRVDGLAAYEGMDGIDGYVAAKYDEIFDGWNVNYGKANHSMRLTVDNVASKSANATVIDIDTTRVLDDGNGNILHADSFFDSANWYKSENEQAAYDAIIAAGQTPNNMIVSAQNSYYGKICGTYETIRAYYLYLPAGESVTIFNGLSVPAEFNNEQTKFFENLTVEVYADAIQAEGFDTDRNAFDNLEEAHPLTSIERLNGKADEMLGAKDEFESKGYAFVKSADDIKNAIADGKNIVLADDVAVDADSVITVAAGKQVTIDLNGNSITSVSENSSANVNVFDVRGSMTIENGTVSLKHEGENMGWSSSTNVFNVTAGGVLNIKNATIENLGGSDMAFCVHLNNWGEVTLNADNVVFKSPYMAIRAFNSGNDMNNITIKNSTLEGNYGFWVHNYTVEDFGTQANADAHAALLNLDIYNGTNTFNVRTAPARYGFTNAILIGADGNPIA